MALETRVAPEYDETKKALLEWRPPRFAYILFETREWDIKENRRKHGLMTLNVENRPDVGHKLHQYVIGKKYKIIHYANFPKANDKNPTRAKLTSLHGGANGENPWDILESEVKTMMDINPSWKEEQSNLLKKLAEMEAKLAKAENGSNEKPVNLAGSGKLTAGGKANNNAT